MTEFTRQQATLFNTFDRVYQQVVGESQRELELARALADDKAAMREASKLEALANIKTLLEQSAQQASLDSIEQRYFEALNHHHQKLTDGLAEARANYDTEAIVKTQIQMSLIGTAEQESFARGTFKAALKQARRSQHG